MAKPNRTCIVCGEKYRYCSHCGSYKDKPAWMRSFDVENCRDIYHAVNRYRTGENTVAETAAALKACDLSKRANFPEWLDEFVTVILHDGGEADAPAEQLDVTESQEPVVEEPKAEEPKPEEAKAEEPKPEEPKVEETPAEEPKSEPKKKQSYKKPYKHNSEE